MSTQTLPELYEEGLEIIKQHGLHQLSVPEDIPYDEMDVHQQDTVHFYHQVDSYLKENKIVENWTNKVVSTLQALPNSTKLELDFTAGPPNGIEEQEKILKRVAYLEKLLLVNTVAKTTKKDVYQYELKLNDKELRIIVDNDPGLVLYVFREGTTYDIFKKALRDGEYTETKNNLNEYMRTLKNIKYLHQFVKIDMHLISIEKSGYIKLDELEKLKANKYIQKNTLTYTELS